MKMFPTLPLVKAAAISLAVMAAVSLAGCGGPSPRQSTAAKKPLPPHPMFTFKDPADNESGAQIWSQNCMRCHQLRSPAQYTPAQWGVIVQYMRLKAGLTGEQAKKVLAFLQSASSH